MTSTDKRREKVADNLYRYKSSGTIYFRMQRKGIGVIEKSTGTTSLPKAKRKAQDILSLVLKEGPKRNKKRYLVEDEWPEFLETKKNSRKNTYDSYEIQGRVHLLPFFGGHLSRCA